MTLRNSLVNKMKMNINMLGVMILFLLSPHDYCLSIYSCYLHTTIAYQSILAIILFSLSSSIFVITQFLIFKTHLLSIFTTISFLYKQ